MDFYRYLSERAKESVAADAAEYNPNNPKPGKYGLSHADGSPCDAKTPDSCPKNRENRLKENEKRDADTLESAKANPLGKGLLELRAKGMSFRKIRDEAAKRAKIKNPEGGTFDLETGDDVIFKTGYQVSFQEDTTEDSSHSHYLDDRHYDMLVENLTKELGARPNLGTFGKPEISWHVESKEKALEVARRHNQESIFKWDTYGTTFYCPPNVDFRGQDHSLSGVNEWTEKAKKQKEGN